MKGNSSLTGSLLSGRLHRIRRAAVGALVEEALLHPKPGLVCPGDSGSHGDMDASLLLRSAFSLRFYFRDVAKAGEAGASFDTLCDLGMAAEQRMLVVTRGVNTHRGAIFSLGLFSAAVGMRTSGEAGTLGEIVRLRWGLGIEAVRPARPTGKGAMAAVQAGIGDARSEASSGFPTLYRWGLPALRSALAEGASRRKALVHTLFNLMARADDTNLVHRGGAAGLEWARNEAGQFLAAGSVFRAGWERDIQTMHREFVRRQLSPGGTADLLAATLFVHAMEDRKLL